MRTPPLACLLLTACATAPAAPSDPAGPAVTDYAPLAVGASWTYDMRFSGQSGERTVRIIQQNDGFFMDDAGGELKVAPDGLRDRRRYLIRRPLVAGTKWKSVVSASAVEHYEIVSVGEACTAKAGTFSDCLEIRSWLRQDAKHTLHNRFLWAKGVGLVKIATTLETGGKRIPQTEQSLVRFRRAGAEGDAEPGAWSR